MGCILRRGPQRKVILKLNESKLLEKVCLIFYKTAAHPSWAASSIPLQFLLSVSYRVFNCILVHFIPVYLTLSFTSFYSFTGIYILLILFLYSILFLSTLFPCCTLYRRGWDYTAWSVFV